MYEFFYLGKYVFNTSRKLIKNLNSTIIYYGIIYYQDLMTSVHNSFILFKKINPN
jgi:hypothetical protein